MEKRRLTELRVVDLRVELEKRSLDKNGVKAALVERLAQALVTEGHDPENYIFDTTEATTPKRNIPIKRQRRTKEGEAEQEGEEDEEEGENGENTQQDVTETLIDSSVEGSNLLTADTEPPAVEDTDDTTIFKIPNPEAVPPQCPFTSEDTIRLHSANRPTGGDDSSSLFVNTDDGGGSERDPSENGDGDKSSMTAGDIKEETDLLADASDTSGVKEEGAQAMANTTTPGEDSGKTTTDTNIKREEDSVASQDDKAKVQTHTGDDKAAKASKGKDLFIKGIASNTRAAEIKTLFSKYGHVSAAKIVQSTKSPGSKIYGYVVMGTPEEAAKCIQHLHRTDFHGRLIEVEPPKKDQLTVGSKKLPTPDQTTSSVQAKKPADVTTPKPNEGGDQAAATTTEDEHTIADTTGIKTEGNQNEAEKAAAAEGEKSSTSDKEVKKQTPKEQPSKDVKPKEKRRSRSKTKSKSRSRSRRRSSVGSRDRRPPLRRPFPPRDIRRPIPYRPSFPSRPPIRGPPMHGRGGFERNLARAAVSRARAFDIRRGCDQEREREKARERDAEERLRRREMEFRQREEKLQLEREKERLKYEREKLERQRLELEQLRMQATMRERMPPPSSSMKRPYDGPSSYDPTAKRTSYGDGPYGGRDHRKGSYDSREDINRAARYSGDSGRSSDRRQSSSASMGRGDMSGRRRDDDYRQRRPDPSGRPASSRNPGLDRRGPPSSARGRDASPPPPPPPRNTASWGGGSSGRHSSSSSRGRDSGYSGSSRVGSGGGGTSYGNGGRSFPQQPTGHAAAPWASTTSGFAGMSNAGNWPRPGINAPVPNVWPSIPQASMFPNAAAGNRFDTYGKPYSGNRRY